MSSKKPKQAANHVIYCGPSQPNGKLQQFQVFRGELPDSVKQLTKETPVLKELFVKVEDFPSFSASMKVNGTRENFLVKNAVKSMKGGNK